MLKSWDILFSWNDLNIQHCWINYINYSVYRLGTLMHRRAAGRTTMTHASIVKESMHQPCACDQPILSVNSSYWTIIKTNRNRGEQSLQYCSKWLTWTRICHTVWRLTAKVIQGRLHRVNNWAPQGCCLVVYVLYHLIISFAPCAKPEPGKWIISCGTAA